MLVALIEDDWLLGDSVKWALTASGFTVEVVATGAAALSRFERNDLDAAVVDMGLPDMDGVDLIMAAREAGMWAPILVATGRAEIQDRVRALEAGADDYIVKPFAIEEIVARLGALGRRAAAPRWAPLAFGRIALSADGNDATIDGQPVKLSPREHALLHFLLRRRLQIVARDEILANVFGYAFNPGTNLVDVHVAHLRRKLEGGGVTIETVRGVGFRLQPAGE